MLLPIAWESSSSAATELSSEERLGLAEILGMLLDVGDVIEAENVMQMFGVHSSTVDIVAVRDFLTLFQHFLHYHQFQ